MIYLQPGNKGNISLKLKSLFPKKEGEATTRSVQAIEMLRVNKRAVNKYENLIPIILAEFYVVGLVEYQSSKQSEEPSGNLCL